MLSFFISSCAPSVQQLSDGKLQVTVDPMASTPFNEIKSEADNKCRELNRGSATNIKKTGGNALTWYYYGFDCKISATAKEEKKKQVELASLIEKAKNTCKSLGFNEGTEKFSDCSLKLYTQSVELAAEQNRQVVMQAQSSGSNVMTIYDPARESRVLINKGQRMLSGACTLGIDC